MRLKQLSLRGFKSFAYRTTLKFEPGITVIVGPNGSGKSNITDAILWVLGEQRARTLRGSSMEDVIFAGSASQPSLGVAEVSLSLDNSDGAIPLDFTEVVITRRLFRSGESEYRINNSSVRLLDIQELLSDSGVGREMYSVISQGRLDEVLSCRPEERRALVEEAAGTLKHKKRKDRALRRLVSMEEYLTRARDVLGEVNRQLEPLRHQADVARQQASLTKELRALEVVVAVAELREYQVSWQDATHKENIAEEQLALARSNLGSGEQSIQTLEARADGAAESHRVLIDKRGETRSVIQRLIAKQMLLQEKYRNVERRIDETQGLMLDLGEREARLTVEVDAGVTELAGIVGHLEEARARLAPQTKELAQEPDNGGLLTQLSSGEQSIIQQRGTLESARAAEQGFRYTVTKLEEEQRLIEQRLASLSVSLVENARTLSGSKKRLFQVKEALEAKARGGEQAKAALVLAQDECNSLSSEIAELNSRLAAATAAMTILRSMEETSDGFEKLANAIVDSEFHPRTLKHLLTVKEGYERAADVALAGAIDALVVGDGSQAARILKNAVDNDVQGEVIVPRMARRENRSSISIPRASELVGGTSGTEDLVDMLLGHIYFASDIDSALAASSELLAHELIVTIDGEVVTGYGGIRSGSGKRLGAMELSKQLAVKAESGKNLESELRQKQAEESRARASLSDAQDHMNRVAGDIHALEVTASGLKQEVAGNAGQLADLETESADTQRQLEVIGERLAAAQELKVDSSMAVSSAEAELAAAEAELAALNKQRETILLQEKAASEELSVLRESVAVLNEKHGAMIALIESLRQQKQNLTGERGGLPRRMMTFQTALNRLKIVMPVLKRLIEAARKLEALLGADLDVSQESAREIRFQLNECRASSSRLRQEIEQAAAAKNSAQVRRVQLEIQVNNLVSRLVDELDVPMERALESTPDDADLAGSRRALRMVRAKLAALGPYNPLAAEQFNELEERSRFLTKQVEDLAVSSGALHKLIGAIDEKMRRRFLSCLDDLNTHFQTVFAKLFPGGQAALVPSDAGDIMEAGIEIEAQPQGKKLQSLALLSGGERALVGLALLFAICYTRPSPFYVLDEVDAPLDDVNTTRLSSLLESLSLETQMIVITHQRRTMEVAGSIYGVSMQSQGVSKLMSQKLGDHVKGGDDESRGSDGEKELAEQDAFGPEQVAN